MELAKGQVTDRPFARTVYTLAAKRFTGRFTLIQNAKSYVIWWIDGTIVAADSPDPTDQPARIALTAGLVDSTTVTSALRLAQGQPDRDSLDILKEVARLSEEQVTRIRWQSFGARATRVFALQNAGYVVDDGDVRQPEPGLAPVDVRWLVYQGLRQHYMLPRLEAEVAGLQENAVMLDDSAVASLPFFGFGQHETGLLDELRRAPVTLASLETASGNLDRRGALAVIYSLVACDCLRVSPIESAAPRPTRTSSNAPPQQAAAPAAAAAAPARGRQTMTQNQQAVPSRRPNTTTGSGSVRQQAAPGGSGRVRNTVAPNPSGAVRNTIPPSSAATMRHTAPPVRTSGTHPRTTIPPTEGGTGQFRAVRDSTGQFRAVAVADSTGQFRTGRDSTGQFRAADPNRTTGTSSSQISARGKGKARRYRTTAIDVKNIVQKKQDIVSRKGTFFELLEVADGASAAEIREAYFKLARDLHPDRLQALGLDDVGDMAQEVFSRINEAFNVLSSPERLAQYKAMLADPNGNNQQDAQELAAKLLGAEEHFLKGQMALRRNHFAEALKEFEASVDLNDQEPQHLALLAWALWCANNDKEKVLPRVLKLFESAIALSEICIPAWFYSAKVAAQMGKLEQAAKRFKRVLENDSNHHEAALELRLLKKRIEEEAAKKKGGLFGRR